MSIKSWWKRLVYGPSPETYISEEPVIDSLLSNATKIEQHDERDKIELQDRVESLQYRLRTITSRVDVVERQVGNIEKRIGNV